MTAFRWLHFTDLHFGMSGQLSLWPNVEQVLLDDLDYLREQVGPWDLVIFTGDLTQGGTKAEFDALDTLLHKIWSRFADWEMTPQLLAIPGNHDLVRPDDETNPALITLLRNWQLPEVQGPFWQDPDCAQRHLVSGAFQGLTRWWTSTTIPKPATLKPGLLPGDWAASVDAGGFKLEFRGQYMKLVGWIDCTPAV
jgi:hypothetical protein